MSMTAQPAVFLDRDGTIIVDANYPSQPEQVSLLPGAPQALALLAALGLKLVIISNQSGIGRGMFSMDDLRRVHERFEDLLAEWEVTLDGAYYCPHAPEANCACRKPAPGLLLRAAEELEIDLAASYMIGDKESDIAAGQAAGCVTILLRPERATAPAVTPDAIVPDLPTAARWVCRHAAARMAGQG